MTTIKYNEIPLWLQDSDFYLSLRDDEPDSLISVPTECFPSAIKHNNTLSELVSTLLVIRFWGAKRIPLSVLNFCHTNEISSWLDAVATIDIPEVRILQEVFSTPGDMALEVALHTSRPEFVDFWLLVYTGSSVYAKNAITQASRYGRLDLVETLREKMFPWDNYAYCAAAQYGHLDIMIYLHEHGCPWQCNAYKYAARGGQLECMKFLFQECCPWDPEATLEFAVSQHFQYVSFYNQLHNIDHPWTDDWSIQPPVSGYIDCLRFALENGCRTGYGTCNAACRYGLLDCLQLLHQYNVPWSYTTASDAASHGHLHCLMYLYENGCPMDESSAEYAAWSGHLDCLRYIIEQDGLNIDDTLLNAAAESGNVDCLSYLVEHSGIDLKTPGSGFGAKFVQHNVATAQYLLNIGCPDMLQSVDVTNDESFVVYLTYAFRHSWRYCERLRDFVEWYNSETESKDALPLCRAYLEEELRQRQL